MDIGKMISKHRGAVMGFSALLIICYHAYWKPNNFLWKYLINLRGDLGVDFFVFLTGFGVVFSLEKNGSFPHYYKRRLQRILPFYYVTLTVMLLSYALAGKLTLKWMLINYIPVGIWISEESACWYVSGTLVYYVIAYMYYFLIRNMRWQRTVLLISVFITGFLVPPVSNIPKIAEMRIPVLLMGVAMGVFSKQHTQKKERVLDLILFAGIFAVGMAIDQVEALLKLPILNMVGYWGPRLYKALIAPFLVFALVYFFELISRTPIKGFVTFFEKIGRYSLEIYLSHLLVRALGQYAFGLNAFQMMLFMLALSYPLAVCISWTGNKLFSVVKKLPVFVPDKGI